MSEPACRRSWGRGRPARLPRPIPRTKLRRTAARTTEIGARDARGPRRPMAFRGGDCPPSAWRDGILVRRGSPGRSRACGPTPRATVPVRRLHGVQLLEDHLVERSLQDLRPNHPHLPVASPHEGPSLMWDGNRKMSAGPPASRRWIAAYFFAQSIRLSKRCNRTASRPDRRDALAAWRS